MSSTNWKTVIYIRVPLSVQNLRSQHLAISDEFIERASIVSSYRLSCIRIAGAITKPPPPNGIHLICDFSRLFVRAVQGLA